ncbi:MAG: hypothetical protein ACK4E0_12065 [Chitinophagaceae bacterium]
MRYLLNLFAALALSVSVRAQQTDSLELERLARMVSLTEVVVRTDVNVPGLIDRLRNDTTFYKAFRNLRVLSFTSRNDVRMLDKKGRLQASLESTTRQHRSRGCRSMQTLNEKSTGDFFDRNGAYNYYTAELYASLFFTRDTVCGEDNIVSGTRFSPRGKKGLAKHKEQLKLLFFNPGKRIPGIPLMNDRKIDPFDPATAELYDFVIDQVDYQQKQAYKFSIRARDDLRAGQRDKIVIDEMITWFDARSMDIMARTYHMSYDAGVYDFEVFMEVEMTRFREYLVPSTIRYKGNWDVAFKPRERGIFTATLSEFSEQ